MSPTITETTPARTQAAILRAVAATKHNFEVPSVAARFDLTLDQLNAITRPHGYPDRGRLARAADELEQRAAAGDNHPTSHAAAGNDASGDVDDASLDGTLCEVPIARVHADPDNPRDTLTDIEELADSIKEVGLLQPIVVRRAGKNLYVVAGHRRLAACRMLHWDVVPVIVRAPMRPDDVLAAMLIENGQRADLDPIEEARGLAKLKAINELTDGAVARKVGRTQGFVSTRLALLALTADEQQQVRDGSMKLAEATHRGRLNAGKVMAGEQTRGWHLSPAHELADRVKARCRKLNHKNGRTVGGIGCGECWETVIRADERMTLTNAATTGVCPTCGHEA
jgi:ParB family chromosome partitioning protein